MRERVLCGCLSKTNLEYSIPSVSVLGLAFLEKEGEEERHDQQHHTHRHRKRDVANLQHQNKIPLKRPFHT